MLASMQRATWMLGLAIGLVVDAGAARHPRPDALVATYGESGASVRVAGADVSLAVGSIGRADPSPVRTSSLAHRRDREERALDHWGAVEWWRSEGPGLEHGVDVAVRPEGDGALVVDVLVGGPLATRDRDQSGIELVDFGGRVVASYTGLSAHDARGRELPSTIEATDRGARIRVDDDAAAYPIVIDPLLAVEEAVLVPAGGVSNGFYGTAIALSADGTLAFVGEPGGLGGTYPPVAGAGAVTVLERHAGGWQAISVLTAEGGAANDQFGSAIAITPDASVVVVGAPNEVDATMTANVGAIRTFHRNAPHQWLEVSSEVVRGTVSGGTFGSALAIASDGSRLLVGAPRTLVGSATTAGLATVWLHTGTSWMLESTLQPADVATGDRFGEAVAMDASGSVAAIGSYLDNTAGGTDAGSVRVYRRATTTWSLEATLAEPTAAASDHFGDDVALDASGQVLAVGASGSATGAVVVFRHGSSWAAEATVNGAPGETFGAAVTITPDGQHVVVGAPSFGGGASGPVRVYDHGGSWTLSATLTYAGMVNGDQLGRGLAVSSDGATVLAGLSGADTATTNNSGAWVAFVKTASWDSGTLVRPDGPSQAVVSVDDTGTRAVVGGGAIVGGGTAAFVYLRSGTSWTLESALVPTAANGVDVGRFGSQVAISGDGMFVAVANADAGGSGLPGQVFVFGRSGVGWTQRAVIQNGTTPDSFGVTLAIDGTGTRIAVGETGWRTPASVPVGAVHVLARTSATVWSEEGLVVSGATDGAQEFGSSLSMSSDGARLLVGARYVNHGATDSGAAYVFTRTTFDWALEASLYPSSSHAYSYVGQSVALSSDGTRAIVGAPESNSGNVPYFGVGRATVFSRSGTAWTEEASLTPSGGITGDRFGMSVGLSGDGSIAVVGSPSQGDPPSFTNTSPGSARSYARSPSGAWSEQAQLVPPMLDVSERYGFAVALDAAGDRALVLSPVTRARGDGVAHVFALTASNGLACAADLGCTSGHCVDGVCCESTCGAGAADCQACSVAAGGSTDGSCTPLTTPTVCRASTGICDLEETCTTTSTTCPPDQHAAAGTVCRLAATGQACDAPEACDGVSSACPADVALPSSTVCRPAAGACDAIETCDGSSHFCPGDAVLPSGASCGGTGPGSCTSAGTCDGTGTSCPGSTLRPAGTLCLARDPSAPCDLDDRCDGVHETCPATYADATVVCDSTISGVCDVVDHCSGTSADCVPQFVSGVMCRPGAGGCDLAELCDGSSPTCPPDGTLPAGTVCRASTGGACDPQESCDGLSLTCPMDVNSCSDGGAIDGGAVDAGTVTPPDASTGSDAGSTPPPPAAGCACRAEAGAETPPLLAMSIALVALLLRRRR